MSTFKIQAIDLEKSNWAERNIQHGFKNMKCWTNTNSMALISSVFIDR